MYNVGVFFLKGLPPHRGHLYQIIQASTECKKLYVVLCDNVKETSRLCEKADMPPIPPEIRKKWLSQELQDFDTVKVILYKESDYPDIQPYPNSWKTWMQHLLEIVPEKIDAFFVGEQEYVENIPKYCDAKVILFEYNRSRYPVSGTLIRENPMKYWDYILGAARPFFAKRILIVGTESTGKTTLTTKLAKLFYTSWSDEVGRHYAADYLGGDETIFESEDFSRIAYLQHEQDLLALKSANKVVFFDTDAVATQYFSEIYLNQTNPVVESFVTTDKYDMVLFLEPDVKWVDDGMRLNGDQKRREALSSKLLKMYQDRGFGDKIEVIKGNYQERLQTSIKLVDNLLNL